MTSSNEDFASLRHHYSCRSLAKFENFPSEFWCFHFMCLVKIRPIRYDHVNLKMRSVLNSITVYWILYVSVQSGRKKTAAWSFFKCFYVVFNLISSLHNMEPHVCFEFINISKLNLWSCNYIEVQYFSKNCRCSIKNSQTYVRNYWEYKRENNVRRTVCFCLRANIINVSEVFNYA